MTGCVVPFCNNSSHKGYSMMIFPKNSIRRALWVQNIPYKNWTLHDNSRICEMHFAAEAWHVNYIRKKLKPDAMPTIFGFYLKKSHIENKNTKKNVDETSSIQNNKCTNDETFDNKATEEVKSSMKNSPVINDISEPSTSSVNTSCVTKAHENKSKECKRSKKLMNTEHLRLIAENNRYKKLIKKQYQHITVMRRQMRTLQNTIRRLQNKNNNDKHKKL